MINGLKIFDFSYDAVGNIKSKWVSGNPLRFIPETTVRYFCRNMKGANDFKRTTMGYKIQPNINGQFKLELIDEPEYCHALIMSPTEREAKLNHGIWLVLLFAVWSVPDRNAIKIAVALAKKFKGKVKLGMRPFDYHQENQLWCPEIRETSASPIWLVFKNGQLVREDVGIQTEEELAQKIRDIIDSCMISNGSDSF